MILESAQMLSTAHHVLAPETIGSEGGFVGGRWKMVPLLRNRRIYAKTHENHPCNNWVRESATNYAWLHAHLGALIREFEFRNGKSHGTFSVFRALSVAPAGMPEGLTPFPNCSLFKDIEVHHAYQKTMIEKWLNDTITVKFTGRGAPEWAMEYMA